MLFTSNSANDETEEHSTKVDNKSNFNFEFMATAYLQRENTF